MRRDLEKKIKLYQEVCREFDEGSEGLETAFKNVFFSLSCLPIDVKSKNARNWLIKQIDKFISEKIVDAETFIRHHVSTASLK